MTTNQKKIRFEAKIVIEVDAGSIKEGLDKSKEFLKKRCLKSDDIKPVRNKRTIAQNSALHLWFTQLAEELNAAGYDMRQVIRQDIEIPWTPYSVKEYLWRPVQRAQLGKKSTTQLDTLDIDRIYEILNKTIGERTGIHVPFPSIETLMDRE